LHADVLVRGSVLMGVDRLQLTSRPVDDGRAFGEVGPCEELTGEAFFAVDPSNAMNQGITDLQLAPRGADGCVAFSADVRILKPSASGNRGIFLEVVNRGGSIFERMTEPGPMGPNTRLSAGWLLQRGFTVVSCGWQHDVVRGDGRFGLTAPEALQNGQPITGKVNTAKQIDAPATVIGPFDGTAPDLGYPVLDVDERDAKLTVADEPNAPREEISRNSWRFVDRNLIELEGGFQLGKTYELTYTAIGAPITGVGFLALRDLVSYLRFSPEWQNQFDFAIAMGASQTGRLLRQMVHGGFCEDEQGRLVIDGVLSIAAGARMTEANWRFGQPSAQGPKSAVFPFTDATQTDQVGHTDGLLKKALERGKVPKIIHLNTSSEYCSSAAISHISAALSHLRTDGKADVGIPQNVRMYHCAGTQHAASPLPLGPSDMPTGLGVYYPNTIDYKPFVRAAIDNLSAWVTRGVDPPASLYPRINDATLVGRDLVRQCMPALPGPGLPTSSSVPDLLPAVDADGNEVSGIRHPDVSVPLATYLGWNPRHPRTGGANLLVRATGSTIPFAATRQQRLERNDPRPSIEERFVSRDAYLERIREAAAALVGQRYLLTEDTAGIVEASARRYDEFTCLDY
jgi:hypothetical protein